MGWWPVNFDLTTDDRIGATPADILDEAFEHIAQGRSHQGEKPPVLQEVLDTLAFLLSTVSADVYEHRQRDRIVRLTASILQEGDPASAMIDSGNCDTLTEDLTLVLFRALQDIAQTYQEAWERLPRLTEVLALFAFVLSDETCSSDCPFSVQSITATTVQIGVLQMWANLFVKHLARRMLPRRGLKKQRQIAARLRQLEEQIAADVDAYGFFVMGVFDPQGLQPLWGYTIGLHHTNPAFSDVLIIGLPMQKIEGMLRLIANKMLKEQVVFEAGQVCSDLTEGDFPCFFAAVDPAYYDAYVGQGLNYYAGHPFPLLQCVWCDAQKLFPWQAGFEEKFRAQQPLLFDPSQYILRSTSVGEREEPLPKKVLPFPATKRESLDKQGSTEEESW